jgi:hypothetical protein
MIPIHLVRTDSGGPGAPQSSHDPPQAPGVIDAECGGSLVVWAAAALASDAATGLARSVP